MLNRLEAALAQVPGEKRTIIGTFKGTVCDVGIIGDKDKKREGVLKVPRSNRFYSKKTITLYESSVIARLNEIATNPPVYTPQVIDVDPYCDEPYSFLTFTPGVSLTNQDIKKLPIRDQEQIGRILGSFIVWMDKSLGNDYDEFLGFIPKEHATREYGLQLWLQRQKLLKKKGYGSLVPILREYHAHYSTYEYAAFQEASIVGHDDLRPENIGFQPTKDERVKVISVFDFAQTRKTSAQSEMRHFALMGYPVLDAARQEYEAQTGVNVDEEGVLFMARTQVLTSCIWDLCNGDVNERTNAINTLQEFFPDVI